MRITKWVEVNQDVEVEVIVDGNDIASMLLMGGDQKASLQTVLYGLSNIMTFLKAVPDERIAAMNEKQFALVVPFLAQQHERFSKAQEACTLALAEIKETA